MGKWQDDAFDGSDDDFDSDDVDSDDAPADTIRCQNCGASIYEDSVRCPRCGWYLTAHSSPWAGRPGWWILLGLLGVLAAVLALAVFR